MTKDSSSHAPATKEDIGMLMEMFGNIQLKWEERFSKVDEQLTGFEKSIEKMIAKRDKILLREMSFMIEHRFNDVKDIWNIKFGGHETRLVLLEQKTLQM